MALTEEDKIEIREIFLAETKKFVEKFLKEAKLSGYTDMQIIGKVAQKPLMEAIRYSSDEILSDKQRLETFYE